MAEDTSPFRYDARLAGEIERRWQERWEREGTFRAQDPGATARPKFYLLDFFPYPSGIGLHVGHPLGYIGTDVFGRYLRMSGRNVLHPFGFDTFGLPAEQYAIDTGQHPAVTVRQNADVMRRQLRRLGLAHDRTPRDHDQRPVLLPLDPVDLPAHLQQLVRPGGRTGPPGRRPDRRVRVRAAPNPGRPPMGRPDRG